jgi:hypothetical protein
VTEAPLVSVIIVNYNGLRFLDQCLTSVLRQDYSHTEVLFVDNGSVDGSADFVRRHFPSVKVVGLGKNLGFAAGNNAGIRAASGDLIATLNNDTEAMPGWISALVRPASDPRVGMCASKMLLMSQPGTIDSAGIEISRSGACWDRGMLEPDDGRYGSVEEVFGPCAGAALYRRSMLDEIGLFDEDFFAYMEDADLAFRGRLAGWKCVYVPDAVVRHYHGGTAGYQSGFSIYYGNRNIVWLAIKNYPPGFLATSAPWIVGRNLATIPFYILKGHGLAILRSKVDALLGIPHMLGKRRYWPAKRQAISLIRTWAAFPGTNKVK